MFKCLGVLIRTFKDSRSQDSNSKSSDKKKTEGGGAFPNMTKFILVRMINDVMETLKLITQNREISALTTIDYGLKVQEQLQFKNKKLPI